MKEFLIRRASYNDAEDICVVHKRSILEICSKDYTKFQITAWAGRPQKASRWIEAMDRDQIWVVENDNTVYGFGHLAIMDEDNAEILGLYFVPSVIGLGLGKKLVKEMVEYTRLHGRTRISLYSTLTSKKFYESCGFLQYSSDTAIEVQGVDIPCHPMEKKLISN